MRLVALPAADQQDDQAADIGTGDQAGLSGQPMLQQPGTGDLEHGANDGVGLILIHTRR